MRHFYVENLTGTTSVEAVGTGWSKTANVVTPSITIESDLGSSAGDPAWPGEAVHLWVRGENLGPMWHVIGDVVWIFDDPGTFKYATIRATNRGLNDRNRRFGYETIHEWGTEGQKTVTAEFWLGFSLMASTTKTIHVDDDFTAGETTLWVPPGYDTSGAPAHDDVVTGLDLRGLPNRRKIVFPYGAEFDLAEISMTDVNFSANRKEHYFRPYGNPADGPARMIHSTAGDGDIVQSQFNYGSRDGGRVAIRDFKLDAPYRTSTHLGYRFGPVGTSTNGTRMSLVRFEMDGCDKGVSLTSSNVPNWYGSTPQRAIFMFDTRIANYANYALFNAYGTFISVGGEFKSTIGGDAGGPKPGGNPPTPPSGVWPEHTVARNASVEAMVIQRMDCGNFQGWPGKALNNYLSPPLVTTAQPYEPGVDLGDPVAGLQAHQDCFRTNVNGHWGVRAIISECIIEGGAWANGGSSGDSKTVVDLLFIRNFCMSHSNKGGPMFVSMPSACIRDNIFVQSYSRKEETQNSTAVSYSEQSGNEFDYLPEAGWFLFYNNTVVCLINPPENQVDPSFSPAGWETAGRFSGGDYFDDNVFIAAYLPGGTDDADDFDWTDVIGSSEYMGMLSHWRGVVPIDESFAVPHSDGEGRPQMCAMRPKPSANAYRSASGRFISAFDFRGYRRRPEVGLSQGAVDPDAVAV